MTRFSLAKSFFMLSVITAALLMLPGCRGNSAGGSVYGEELYKPKHSSGFSIYSAGVGADNIAGNTSGSETDNAAGDIVSYSDGNTSGNIDEGADKTGDTEKTGGFSETSEAGGASSVLVIRNPWQGAEGVAMEVFLSRGGEKAPEGFGGTVVPVPLRRVVCLSSSHAAFIDALGLSDAIVGVSGAKYISNEQLRGRYERGELADVGYDTNLNYELLASLEPDLVFIYGISGQNTALEDKLRELGISSLYIGEYVEETALGKAEWIVPFGELMGRRAEAESIFGHLAARYEELKEMAQKAEGKPSVMLNSPYRDVWFVPGGRSYMAALIADAGGEYLFAHNNAVESMPLSGEAAYVAVSGADIWLNPNQARTINELEAQTPKFVDIPAVRQRQVYNATRRSTPEGGSDFWESGALRADRVLEDLIIIMHPELIPDGELYYFERLD